MKHLVLFLTFTSTLTFAKDCVLKANKDQIKLEWTAFKTPSKNPVAGRFRYLGIKKDLKGKDLKELLEGITFNIDSASTSTKNTARDANIVKYFFQKVSGGLNITGQTKSYSKKKLLVDLQMNGKNLKLPLKVTKEGKKIEAIGTIDLFDLNLHSALASINKACYELHEGKTWNDIGVKLTLNLDQDC